MSMSAIVGMCGICLLVSVVPWQCPGGATVVPWQCLGGARSKIKSSISTCLTLLLAYQLLDDDDNNNNTGSISKTYCIVNSSIDNIVLPVIVVVLQKDCAMPVMVLLVISSRFLCIGHHISLCIGHCVCQGVEI